MVFWGEFSEVGVGTDQLIDHVIVYPDCQFVGIECCLRD